MSLELRARAAVAAIDIVLAFNPHQRRDSRGRWTRMPDSELKRPRQATPRRKLLGRLMDGPLDKLRGADLEQIRAAFGFEDAQTGLRAEVTDAQVSRTSDGTGQLLVRITISDSAGRSMGDANRTFERDPSTGELSVKHGNFTLYPEARNGGFSSRWLAQMEDRYRRMGVGRIELSTAGVGGYAWAKAGFDFADDFFARSLADQVDARLSGGWGIMGPPPGLREQLDDLIRRAGAGGDERPLPVEFAMLGWQPGAETWPGKKAMVGALWDGVKRL